MCGTVLYFEGKSGASGDMILASLLDLGFPVEALQKSLDTLSVPLRFESRDISSNQLRAKSVKPLLPEEEKKEWKLADFLSLLNNSKLSSGLKERACSVFNRLGKVEAKVHGKTPDSLHFHELGGWDTIFDIVGSVAALDFFSPSEIFVGPLNLGGGMVESQHGRLPVPAPAVVELMKGFPVYSSSFETELLTPTGAAILTTFGKPTPHFPRMIVEQVGHGAGEKKLDFPNILRVFQGELLVVSSPESILKLETNVDDMNPQFWDHVFDRLYERGAHEVFLTQVLMKKNRLAYLLTVLAPVDQEATLMEIIFQETTTLGIRREIVTRNILPRKFIQVKTPYGEVPCKVGYQNGKVFNVAPEYDVLKKLSKEKKIPLKQLYQQVLAQAEQQKELN